VRRATTTAATDADEVALLRARDAASFVAAERARAEVEPVAAAATDALAARRIDEADTAEPVAVPPAETVVVVAPHVTRAEAPALMG
jgi:hypothetical protein